MQSILKNTSGYQLLQREVEKGSSHAYLLLFEDGRFLPTALKSFAKLLLDCAEPKTREEKRRAELVENESFADCLFYPEQGKKLVVEDAEKILEESTLAPVEGDKKLFVLGDFAEANVQTQNKLLKLLEEPPKGVVFLLGATSVFPVLPTVLSRTKRLEIPPFSAEEVTACLQRLYENKYERSALELCAAASSGNVGVACAMLEGGKYASLTDTAFSLLLSPIHKLPALVKQAGETPHKRELLNLLRLICRDSLLLKSGIKGGLLLPAERARSKEVAMDFDESVLLFAQEELSKAEKQVKFNAVFPQCLGICIANIRERKNYGRSSRN